MNWWTRSLCCVACVVVVFSCRPVEASYVVNVPNSHMLFLFVSAALSGISDVLAWLVAQDVRRL